jgi:hypothetical protein
MKRCAQCGGKLGIRFRNFWNRKRNWFEHKRFCSAFCEANYELEREQDRRKTDFFAFLAGGGR